MMQSLTHYATRSPRYILHPLDNSVIRFIGPQRTPWEEATEIKNISLSGLAFTVPVGIEPRIKELLGLEFEVPGQEKFMACYAQVVRLEKITDQRLLVSVRFHDLSSTQKFFLLSGLLNRIRDSQVRPKKWYSWRRLSETLILASAFFAGLVTFFFQNAAG